VSSRFATWVRVRIQPAKSWQLGRGNAAAKCVTLDWPPGKIATGGGNLNLLAGRGIQFTGEASVGPPPAATRSAGASPANARLLVYVPHGR
ncbi:MAG: hypothetical protein ACTHOU_19365, partial [Aureliella sp.]